MKQTILHRQQRFAPISFTALAILAVFFSSWSCSKKVESPTLGGPASVDNIWKEHQFPLSLDQALILAMGDEARWMIKNNLTKEKQVPDFMNYIYVDGLKAVRPEAVNIIR